MQPGGEIFAYDIRLYIPGTEEVIVNLGNKNFYIIQDDIILIPRTSILVQVPLNYHNNRTIILYSTMSSKLSRCEE